MRLLFGIAALSALMCDGAHAQDRVELAPNSNWVMSYDEDSCTLKRQFGEEGGQAYLELRQFGPFSGTQVIVASKDFRVREGGYTVAFLPPDQEPQEFDRFNVDLSDGYKGKLFGYTLGDGDPRVKAARREFMATAPGLTDEARALLLRSLDLAPETREFQRLAKDAAFQEAGNALSVGFARSEAKLNLRDTMEGETEGLLLERAFNKPLYLRTGNLHPPMEAMRTCIDDLLTHWGIDVNAHKTLSRQATPLDYPRIVREMMETYPAAMVMRGMQGYLRVRLDLGADGMPTGCHMQVEYNEDEFERLACRKLMQHARFSPALDRDGQPIASFWQTAIQYRLGE